jgi:hypothetical protein
VVVGISAEGEHERSQRNVVFFDGEPESTAERRAVVDKQTRHLTVALRKSNQQRSVAPQVCAIWICAACQQRQQRANQGDVALANQLDKIGP